MGLYNPIYTLGSNGGIVFSYDTQKEFLMPKFLNGSFAKLNAYYCK
jgi:hypothetical protein